MEPSKLESKIHCGSKEKDHGKLLVTELCFAMDNSEKNSIETAFNLMFGNTDDSKELSLLTCAKCNVTVHNCMYDLIF